MEVGVRGFKSPFPAEISQSVPSPTGYSTPVFGAAAPAGVESYK